MPKQTFKTSTGESVRYRGRFRYLVVNRTSTGGWYTRKRTNSIETARAELSQAFRWGLEAEIIDTREEGA